MGESRRGDDPQQAGHGGTLVASMAMAWRDPPPPRVPSMVRELLTTSYAGLVEADELQRVAMVAHEMLENLVKYASEGPVTFAVELHDRDGGTVAELRSSNCATAEHLREAEGILTRLGPTAHAVTAYDELIAESTQRTGSRLGLARIRAEGEMGLEGFIEKGRITLVAQRRVGSGRGS